jgi:hypothetical protein
MSKYGATSGVARSAPAAAARTVYSHSDMSGSPGPPGSVQLCLAMGGQIIFTPPYLFRMEVHKWNIQGAQIITLPPMASGAGCRCGCS